jgi:hypothetical protein
MPAQHRLRFEDHHHLIETLTSSCIRSLVFIHQRCQHYSLWISYPRGCRHLALQDPYLLAQEDDLQILIIVSHPED